MAEKRPALGRGLSALIPDSPTPVASSADRSLEIDIDLLRPNKFQPRTHVDDERIEELSRSIRANGIIQPIVARKVDEGYEIIAGERRWRAAQRAGLLKVPVVVRDIPEDRLLAVALIENIQREDLNPIEEAQAYRKLLSEGNLTQEELAKRLGQSRAKIANGLRLLTLPKDISQAIETGQITAGHAQVLAGMSEPEQRKLFERIKRDQLSVRATEAWRPKRRPVKQAEPAPTWLRQLEHALGTEVKRQGSDDKGSLVIRYHSTEQLNGLLEQLLDRTGNSDSESPGA